MAKLIGNAPNQVPTNADLGSMAFEDKKNYATTSSSIHQPFRNLIINGDMRIAQRGTSQANAGSSSGSYQTLDRYAFLNGNVGAFTWSQDTDVPTGQGFTNSMKFDCTTADASPASADYLTFHNRIEGQMLQYLKKGTSNAESWTLSFWVKSNKTGTYIIQLLDTDNNRTISSSYTVLSASTWEKKTITFAGDTTGAFNNDNNKSLEVRFWLATGSSYSSGTLNTSWNSWTLANTTVGQVNLADTVGNEFYITGIQLEAGTSASDFEFLPHDVNLRRCLRYCWKHGGEATGQFLNAQGAYYDANYIAFGLVSPPVPMRVAPSLTVNGTMIVHRLNTDYTGWNWGFITGVQSQSWFVSANKSSHGVTAQHSVVKCSTTSDFFIYSSEL
jgi:hypothetical protein